MAGFDEVTELSRRAEIRKHLLASDYVERVVAEHVRGEQHDGWARPHRKAGPLGAQHLVPRDRVDPDPSCAHLAEHEMRRARLHRVARLQPLVRRELRDRVDPTRENLRIVEEVGSADLLGEAVKGPEIGRRMERHPA